MEKQIFAGAYTLTPFGQDCLIEVLYDPAPSNAGPPIGALALPPEYTQLLIPSGSSLCIGRISAMPERPADDSRPSEKIDSESLARMLAKVSENLPGILPAAPDVKTGDLVLYRAGRTTAIPVEGYERTRLLPLSAIVGKLEG